MIRTLKYQKKDFTIFDLMRVAKIFNKDGQKAAYEIIGDEIVFTNISISK